MHTLRSSGGYRTRLDDLDARIRAARDGCPAGQRVEADALSARSTAFRSRLDRTPDSEWEKVGDDLQRDWDDLTAAVERWIETVGREDGRR
ncbi:MAG: hypothetical protein AB7O49_15090 [Sphingomonadales bacterium]